MAQQKIDRTAPKPGGKFGDDIDTITIKINANIDDLEQQLAGKADDADIAAEVAARTAGDQALQQSVDTKASQTALQAETDARIAAVLANTNAIATKASQTALQAEIDARIAAVSAEVTARQNADTSINNIISTYKSAAKADIVGTITQSGGVPSGAIFESGSNANGQYFKFANGLMICYRSVGPIGIPANATYNGPTYTFAASFVATPICLLQVSGSFPFLLDGNFEPGITLTQYRYSIASRYSGAIGDIYAGIVAIGRWY